MRTIVDLPEEQMEALKQMSRDTRLSRAELMRRAVKEYLMRHQPRSTDEAFGIWQARHEDALEVQEKLRSEWGQ